MQKLAILVIVALMAGSSLGKDLPKGVRLFNLEALGVSPGTKVPMLTTADPGAAEPKTILLELNKRGEIVGAILTFSKDLGFQFLAQFLDSKLPQQHRQIASDELYVWRNIERQYTLSLGFDDDSNYLQVIVRSLDQHLLEGSPATGRP